ncbi:Eco57I restriction-modification methylase domain-containing protein [Dolosigranulum pigrum]|uniref:Eco57I restriction-modification methylase domain-containing protein n=1 Tax=Dolosigranulum pigrum TaxID=29394 RepID=UPI0036F39B0E
MDLEFNEKFDYIVGNPPYISYANIDTKNREFIRKNFDSCKKKANLIIAIPLLKRV